jgi:SAM-dependent methyltransferase
MIETTPCLTDEIKNQLFDESSHKVKLNLGCGPDYLEGWHNVDNDRSYRADEYYNLDDTLTRYPYDKNKFDLILVSHVFEHLHNASHFWSNTYRIAKPGGWLVIVSPYFDSPDAWGDPTHCRGVSEESFFDDFTEGWNYMQYGIVKAQKASPAVHEVRWIWAKLQKGAR